jgi:hypothetical protein
MFNQKLINTTTMTNEIKQKTIIQVWGPQGEGKTSTIQLIREELILAYINPAHTYPFPKKKEISDLLICNGFKVGIESSGDDIYYNGLNQRLDDFIVKQAVDILICTSRVRNNVDAHIKKLATQNGYRILKVTNYRSDDPGFIQDALNQLAAKHLVLLTDQILRGII